MKRKLYLFASFYLLLFSQVLGQSSSNKAYTLMLKGLNKDSVPYLRVAALQAKLQQQAPLVVLDIRSGKEYAVSHIAGARLVPYDNFDVSQVQGIAKDTPLVVYCSVGYRSEQVGEQLLAAGYTNVRNLYGGLFEWVNQGYPVYNQKGKTSKVHAYSKTWGIWLQKGEKVYE